jgi:rod shape-determining protein MreC
MEFLLNRFRNLTVLLLVILAQLVLLAYQVKSNEDVRLIRVWSVTAVTPLAKVLEVVRRNTIGLIEDYFVLLNVREQNRNLNVELGRLKMENQFLKTELQTADRARALQAFQSRTPSRTLAARIIGTGTGANSRVVFVDQGSHAGVMRGMAVVTPDGIVGKVLASYPTASQVLLITDSTFAAGVISDKNRVHGTVKGQGQSKCLVDYVQNEEKVEVGEIFYTSGDDRIFPKGMPVGKVSVVRPGKTFKEIYLVPSGFQQGLEEVLIVVEGVHQQIPDATAEPSPDIYIMPPAATPPVSSTAPAGTPHQGTNAASPAATPAGISSGVMTDADRLREKYKQIGEAQKHVFGTGLPGSKPPDFNLDLDRPKPGQPGTAAHGAAPPGSTLPAQTGTAPAKPATGTSNVPAQAGPSAAGQPAVRTAPPATPPSKSNATAVVPEPVATQPPKPKPAPGATGAGTTTTAPVKPAVETPPASGRQAPPPTSSKPRPDPDRETPVER